MYLHTENELSTRGQGFQKLQHLRHWRTDRCDRTH